MLEGEDNHVTKIVLQFLCESGYNDAFEALKRESGVFYDSDSLEHGGELLTIMGEYYERKANENVDSSMRELEFELMDNNSKEESYANKEVSCVTDLHKKNILCVDFHSDPTSNLVLTGSSDQTVLVTDYVKKEVKYRISDVHTGGILSVMSHPIHRNLAVSGAMDATHCIFDIETGSVLQRFTDHKKYVVHAKFSPDGRYLCSASYDKTVNIYGLEAGTTYSKIKTLYFVGTVEGLAFSNVSVDSSENQTPLSLIISARSDNYLYYVDLSNGVGEVTKVNMNANGDDHVSFTAMDIQVSSDNKFTLVATDKNRLIVFKYGTNVQVRNIYGIRGNNEYSQPRSCFDAEARYIYCTSGHTTEVYNLYNQKLIHTFSPEHQSVARCIAHHPTQEIIASVGFDKTLKIFARASLDVFTDAQK